MTETPDVPTIERGGNVFECEGCGVPRRLDELDDDGHCSTCHQAVRVIVPHAHPHVVTKLEEWLERAQRGDIVGLLIIGESASGGTVEYSYAGKYSSKLVGGAELAKHWIMHKLEEED
jgi:hypothetical protein